MFDELSAGLEGFEDVSRAPRTPTGPAKPPPKQEDMDEVSETTTVFEPVPSLEEFFTSDMFQSFAVGPVGSTKTTASIMKIAYEAKRMAKSKNGIRKSRCVVVRNTKQQLHDTTIPDFMKWFPPGVAGTYHKTENKFILKFDDVECEVLFRGLDDANDVRRLLSLQLSFAMLDECREINKDVFNALTGRLGRYPDGMLVPHRPEWGVDEKGYPIKGCVDDYGNQMKKVWGATNPPDMDTFWHKKLSKYNKAKQHVTIQPSGMAQEADWIHLLDRNYYEDLMEGKDEDWIDVYVHAKWGKSLAGKPVFKSFHRATHVATQPLRPLNTPDRPLVIGMDFGLNPSITVTQMDPFGRLLVLADATSDGMGVTRFIQTVMRPMLAQKFPGLPVVVVGDPAGAQRAQTDERSCFDILKANGFRVVPAKTNSLVARIAAVDGFLTRHLDGRSGMLIDPECVTVIDALQSGYRYKMKKTGDMEDTPEKGKYSHIADALQYACLHANEGTAGFVPSTKRREIEHRSAAGWT